MPRKSLNSGLPSPEERYRMIEGLLDAGYKSSDIGRVLEEKGGVTLRQIQRDLQKVRVQRSQLLNRSQDELRAENYHRFTHIYKESLKHGERVTALKALHLQGQMLNKQISRGERSHALSDSTGIPEHELEALLAAFGEDRLAE